MRLSPGNISTVALEAEARVHTDDDSPRKGQHLNPKPTISLKRPSPSVRIDGSATSPPNLSEDGRRGCGKSTQVSCRILQAAERVRSTTLPSPKFSTVAWTTVVPPTVHDNPSRRNLQPKTSTVRPSFSVPSSMMFLVQMVGILGEEPLSHRNFNTRAFRARISTLADLRERYEYLWMAFDTTDSDRPQGHLDDGFIKAGLANRIPLLRKRHRICYRSHAVPPWFGRR